MTIYIDSDFRCHLTNDGAYRAIETDAFEGRCSTYIEGYRFIPAGESWMRSDGTVFNGEMISPAEDYSKLVKAQEQYELDETIRWNSLNVPQEENFVATRNYIKDSFLVIQGKLFRCTYPIPRSCNIVQGNNVLPATVDEYLEYIKETEK